MNRRNQLQERLSRIDEISAIIRKELREIEQTTFVRAAKKNIGKWYSNSYMHYKIVEVKDDSVKALCVQKYEGNVNFYEETLTYTDLEQMTATKEMPDRVNDIYENLKKMINQ